MREGSILRQGNGTWAGAGTVILTPSDGVFMEEMVREKLFREK
jgi:hypothetical protein